MISIPLCSNYKLAQLWKTHKRGSNLAAAEPYTSNMLFFYAVECGLKHLLVQLKKLTFCPRPGKREVLFSHDLTKILNELQPSRAEIIHSPKTLRLLLPGPKDHSPFCDVHLAWRYGLNMDPVSEREIREWLKKVDRFIVKRRQNP